MLSRRTFLKAAGAGAAAAMMPHLVWPHSAKGAAADAGKAAARQSGKLTK